MGVSRWTVVHCRTMKVIFLECSNWFPLVHWGKCCCIFVNHGNHQHYGRKLVLHQAFLVCPSLMQGTFTDIPQSSLKFRSWISDHICSLLETPDSNSMDKLVQHQSYFHAVCRAANHLFLPKAGCNCRFVPIQVTAYCLWWPSRKFKLYSKLLIPESVILPHWNMLVDGVSASSSEHYFSRPMSSWEQACSPKYFVTVGSVLLHSCEA